MSLAMLLIISCNNSKYAEEISEKDKMDSIIRMDSIKASQTEYSDSVFIDSTLL